jgi:hypothetical protein
LDATNKQRGSNPVDSERAEFAVPVAKLVSAASGSPTNPPIPTEAFSNTMSIDSQHDSAAPPIAVAEIVTTEQSSEPPRRSWVLRTINFFSHLVSSLFGIASVVFLLAVTANVPILQFLSFGYLLEVSGRLARRQKFSDAMIGLRKASVLGSIVLGTWLMILPIRFVSNFWFEAYLIDPSSSQTQFLRVLQIVLIGLVVAHIGAAWLCGGKLRYFFWPVIAPFSFAVWLARRLAGWKYFRSLLSLTTGWMAPGLADEICTATPVTDWFLPAIFVKRIRSGHVLQTARDGVWNFFRGLNLPYYFLLGLKGFVGTFAWLLIPTLLLVTSTYQEGGAAVLSGLLGALIAIPVFAMLPFLQAHFATDGKLRRFLEVRQVFRNFAKAPLAHWLALLIALMLALPLFFLKVETIPSELLWTLSVVFVVFTWPAKIMIGWAYGRGAKREQPCRWWLRYPLAFMTIPVSFSFVMIFMLTRYISWNGALSLFENHVFLLPAPFWQ